MKYIQDLVPKAIEWLHTTFGVTPSELWYLIKLFLLKVVGITVQVVNWIIEYLKRK